MDGERAFQQHGREEMIYHVLVYMWKQTAGPHRRKSLHYYLKIKPPNNRRIDDTQKEIPTAARKKQRFVLSGCGLAAFFLFALLVEGKEKTGRKLLQTTTTPTTTIQQYNNHNNTQEAIRTTSAKSLNPGSRGNLSRLNPTTEQPILVPRTSLPPTKRSWWVSECTRRAKPHSTDQWTAGVTSSLLE